MTTRGQSTRQLPGLDVTFVDDPVVAERAATEDYTTHIMPLSWRTGRLSLTMANWSLVSGMFWMYVGGLVASVVGTTQAVIGMILSVALYGAINYVLANYAIRTGLTSSLLSRRVFGTHGALLAPLIFAATCIYYTVFEGSIIAVALQEYFGAGDIRVWYLVVIVAAVPLVLGGVRVWLDRFNGVLLPFYVIGVTVTLIWIGIEHDASLSIADPGADLGAPGWLWTVSVYMGVFILMLITIDFGRFGRPGDEKYHGTVSFGVVFYGLLILGNGLVGIFIMASGVLDGAVTEAGIANAIVATMGLIGLLFVIISQTRANTANLYLASTNTEMLLSRLTRLGLPRLAWTIVAAAIAYAIMLTDVFSYILRALNWQGAFVVAWVGIVLVHIGIEHVTKTKVEFRSGRLAAATPALAVWVVVSAIGVYMIERGGAHGPTWAPIVTFVLSAVGYLAVYRYRTVIARPHDPREEVEDVWEARIRCHACNHSYIAVEMDRDPSAGHQAICSDCADRSSDFLRASRAEEVARR